MKYLSNPYVLFVLVFIVIAGLYMAVKNFYKVDLWLCTFQGATPYRMPTMRNDFIVAPGLVFGLVYGVFTMMSGFTTSNPEPAIKLVGIICVILSLILVIDCFRCFGLAAGFIRVALLSFLNGLICVISLVAGIVLLGMIFIRLIINFFRAYILLSP